MRVNSFEKTAKFDSWLRSLADPVGKARILARLRAAMSGNFGDCAPVGEAVMEMRVHFGPGYRVYFTRVGKTVYWLLCGGDKSTQQADIKRAKNLAAQIRQGIGNVS
jgi:putative addiction module killer protein